MTTLSRRDETITIEMAFHALHYFVAELHARLPDSTDLAALAADTAMIGDGMPADPAAWSDFLEAIDRAKSNGPPYLKLRR